MIVTVPSRAILSLSTRCRLPRFHLRPSMRVAFSIALSAAIGCQPSTEREVRSPEPADRISLLAQELSSAADQFRGGDSTRAHASLARAAEMLRSDASPKSDARIRIAGWVTVADLSRKLNDMGTADAACDRAVAGLRTTDPVADRPRFALGVADEVRQLHGNAAAVALLVESIQWVQAIPGRPVRRQVLFQTADYVFACDDRAAGLAVLGADPDPKWQAGSIAELSKAAGDGTGLHDDLCAWESCRDVDGNLIPPPPGRPPNWVEVPNFQSGQLPSRISPSPRGERYIRYRAYIEPLEMHIIIRRERLGETEEFQ